MDAMFAVGGALLLALVVLPVLAADDPKIQRETCMNNLRIIGQASATYAMDHQNRLPWLVPVQEGGSHGMGSGGNTFIQFLYLTNGIPSPSHLACPADAATRPASTWAPGSATGILHPDYRNNAVSYLIGLDAKTDAPNSILSADASLFTPANNQLCDVTGIKNAAALSPGDEAARWNSQRHGDIGNVLFQHGGVKTLDSGELKSALGKAKGAHPENHALLPR